MKKEAKNLKDNKESYRERLGGNKGKEETL